MSWLNLIFGDANEKYIKSLQAIVRQINDLEKDIQSLSATELRNKTTEFRNRINNGTQIDDLLPEAFAVVREAAKRTLKQRHFDVQLIGGIVLHHGQIAEMRTGEGKTLTATLPVYLNALSGKGVHVVTVNDYLAKRDATWMGQIYNYLGLSVGVIQHETAYLYDSEFVDENSTIDKIRDQGVAVEQELLKPCQRQQAYAANITYGTNNEFGFDYLKDNMVATTAQMVQRELNFAIVDEVDSILIDEARTPLIISAPAEESTDEYFHFAKIVRQLQENIDYNKDEKLRAVTLTEDGMNKMEKILGVENIYQSKGLRTVHHLEQALKAEVLFKKDKDYVVKDDEVIIVDEFTGRLMFGRRYSEGLHQAIEAKENVKIQKESLTLATITFQNYFRLYQKLSGMTGTAATEAEEFAKIYKLDVTIVPPNKEMIRNDQNDLIYQNEASKFKAIIEEIKKCYQKKQPVLVGTISIEKNELLSELLNREGIPHQLLNAKQHEKEASIIAQAGKLQAVTIATNMAGRGVDIILGGNPADPDEAEKVRSLGGLLVIGTERHESRRIDNQLRGRAGRQGDPGSTLFYVSLDDDLMRIFGSDRMKGLMKTLKVPEDMPIENGMISKSIESAQRKVEGHNFDIRKHLVEYDDVINKHREVIYKRRKNILLLAENKVNNLEWQNIDGQPITSLSDYILDLINQELDQVINFHTTDEGQKDYQEILETIKSICQLADSEIEQFQKIINDQQLETHQIRHQLIEYLRQLLKDKYSDLASKFIAALGDATAWSRVELSLILRTIDNHWIDHLESIDYLKQGIGLRGYGQRDPLVEYKKEAFQLFNQLLDSVQNEIVYNVFKLGETMNIGGKDLANRPLNLIKNNPTTQFATEETQRQANDSSSILKQEPKVGRNEPCPCGSGKKYKKCCGN